MRILLLGMNYGSIINTLNIEFNRLSHKSTALCFEIHRSSYNNYSAVEIVYKRKYSTLFFKLVTLNSFLKLGYLVLRSDVIHIFSDLNLQTRYENTLLHFLFNVAGKKKKKFITFLGSEVRNRNIEMGINPYYKMVCDTVGYEYKLSETEEHSVLLQKKFADLGFKAILNAEVMHYINKSILPVAASYFHPGKFSASNSTTGTELRKTKLKFIHAATAPCAKGTRFVEQAIKNMKVKGYDFDFVFLQNVQLSEFENQLKQCDVYLDQFIWGWYGIAAIQAMSYGIPVISFLGATQLSSSVHVPIMNATIATLEQTMENILIGKINLKEKSEETLSYYNKYHHPQKVAGHLVSVYMNSKCK